MSLLLCQEALSSKMTESSCHPGASKSYWRMKYCRNMVITSASVLAWVSEYHILPSVSRATISEILGATCLSVTEPEASVGTQILRRNLVWLIQLWSILIILFFDSNRGKILRAYCYHSTKQRSSLL